MKVNKCETINFYGKDIPVVKNRRVTQKIQNDAKILLNKMNAETKYEVNKEGTNFTSNILSRIMLDDKTSFIDERIWLRDLKDPKKNSSICSLKMGKTELHINSDTGVILNHKKSIFKTWKSIYAQAEKCMQDFVTYFDEPTVVTKKFFPIAGYTRKGIEEYNKIMKKLGYYV